MRRKKIKVTYYNVTSRNANGHIYSREVIDVALSKFHQEDFWVVSKPSENNEVALSSIVGKVLSVRWSNNDLIFEIELYCELSFIQSLLELENISSGMCHFCLFGYGDVTVLESCTSNLTVSNFVINGMFLSPTCAWSDEIIFEEENS